MAVEKIPIDSFLEMSERFPVLDVRSPKEFVHAHIPGAYNLALFSDEERKIVGTAYKNQGRETAIKLGLDFFGVKMRSMVEEVESIVRQHRSEWQGEMDQDQEIYGSRIVLVHCWRGGMRSSGVAWLLDLYGFKVYTLISGYKSFRRWVLEKFHLPFSFKILGGFTGSGKTKVLKELAQSGKKTIDLEDLAHHRGSAFGSLGKEMQPSQEMFENKLAIQLCRLSGLIHNPGAANGDFLPVNHEGIWLEDESQRIGQVNIPNALWETMREAPLFFLDIPFEKRLEHICLEYGPMEKVDLAAAINRIHKRLGGLETKMALQYLYENSIEECFRILLRYYDILYFKGLHSRKELPNLLTRIECSSTNAPANAGRLLESRPVLNA